MEWLINRRRMMMNKTAPPPEYITDGLVFHLDGIDKGPNPGTWTDLIGGIEFTNTNVVATQYGWEFDGTASSYFRSTYIFPASDDYTIEVCFKPITGVTSSYGLFFSGTNTVNNLIFFKATNTITWLQRNYTFNYAVSVDTFHSISANLDSVLCDNSPISFNSGTDYWTSANVNYTWIGTRGSSNFFKGEIYSIRIYNRRLTQAEQINNYKADKGRFK